ncbi:MAG TPA: protein translocase subunit SecD [Acidimicrobiales bacterium]|nr:protein translocase subunit SecD [Acidimicrobiales bacterium]
MRRKLLLSLVFILVLAFGGLAATLAAGNSPELGLDLQGGVSVVLAPTTDASGEQLDQALSIIRDRVDALGVAEPDIARQGDAIVVQLPGVKNRDRALALVGQTAQLRFRPVIQSAPLPEGALEEQAKAEEEAAAAGDAAATTTTAPADPNATTTTSAPSGTTATSEGAIGLAEGESAGPAQEPPTTAPPDPTATTVPADPNATTTTVPETPPDGEAPSISLTPRQDDAADQPVVLAGIDDQAYDLGPSLADGTIVKTASADIQNGQWLVRLEMRGGANGIDKFNEIAAKCYQQAPDPQICPSGQLAVVLDSVVQSAPSISEPSYDADQIQISGSFTESEAKDLALVLRYGSLPVELERQSVQTVSASLGDDSLRAGVIAGLVGLGLVALYMLLYYRALGLVVIVGLGVWASLLYTIVSFLGETQGLALTLAGVTGIIVSIGVTVDSYVVYFERLKDEVKAGRTLRSSTERAFTRAFRTILAADVSAFIGAAVLWWLTVGSVRGFAFFLGLSTVLDVFVAWFFTRPTVTLLSRNAVFTDMPVFGVARGLARRDEPRVAAAGVGR